MVEILGYIGTAILLASYILLNVSRYEKYFIPVAACASFLLTIHAVIIVDIPFIIVNTFITIMLGVRWFTDNKRSLI